MFSTAWLATSCSPTCSMYWLSKFYRNSYRVWLGLFLFYTAWWCKLTDSQVLSASGLKRFLVAKRASMSILQSSILPTRRLRFVRILLASNSSSSALSSWSRSNSESASDYFWAAVRVSLSPWDASWVLSLASNWLRFCASRSPTPK